MISVARFIHAFLTAGVTYNKGRLLVCHWLQEQTRTRGMYEGNCSILLLDFLYFSLLVIDGRNIFNPQGMSKVDTLKNERKEKTDKLKLH